MKLFQQAMNTQAYLKAGLYGFEGSGKSFTASLMAIGLCKYAKLEKPVAFFDTETGSTFVKPLFDAAGVPLVVVQSHALKTLAEAFAEAERECSVLIIDSLTDIYRELCSAYVRRKNDGTNYIRIQDWQPIKEQWAASFAKPYVNGKLHVIWCARAKNIFQDVEDEMASRQTGRQQFKSVQVGTGARTETESAYEPSVLAEMRKELIPHGKDEKNRFVRVMTVDKERFNIIDGQSFEFQPATNEQALKENKPFQAILPHIQRLNMGGSHLGFRAEDSSEALFDHGTDAALIAIRRRREIALDRIENDLVAMYPASTGKDKTAKLQVIDALFGTTSWKEISIKGKADDLELAAEVTKALLNEALKGATYEDINELRARATKIRDDLAALDRSAPAAEPIEGDEKIPQEAKQDAAA